MRDELLEGSVPPPTHDPDVVILLVTALGDHRTVTVPCWNWLAMNTSGEPPQNGAARPRVSRSWLAPRPIGFTRRRSCGGHSPTSSNGPVSRATLSPDGCDTWSMGETSNDSLPVRTVTGFGMHGGRGAFVMVLTRPDQ